MTQFRPRRTVLYVPASNMRAMEKSAAIGADCIIYDLEDAVGEGERPEARERLRQFFAARPESHAERVIRINPLASTDGTEDFMAARACRPDAVLLPKVGTPQDVLDLADAFGETDAPDSIAIWAMVETARGLMNIGQISELGRNRGSRLACLVTGTNDIVKETGTSTGEERRFLVPWLMQIILAARAGGLAVLDGVYNDFRDMDGFVRECAQSAAMGFDGKTLIHPVQIEPAAAAFSPGDAELAEARAIVEAFLLPENRDRNVLSIDGRMVERLHFEMAQRTLSRAGNSP